MSKNRPNPTSGIPQDEVDQSLDVPATNTSSSASSSETPPVPTADQGPEHLHGSTSEVTTNNEKDSVSAADKPLDPTRYGDWVKNGRCIDF